MKALRKRHQSTGHPKGTEHSTPSDAWRAAADEFTGRVRSELGEGVDAIVLYGSVARREATAESDIDLLIVAPATPRLQETLSKIRSQFDKDSDYAFSFSVQHLTLAELDDRLRRGSPYLDNVLAEGVPLYDSGSYARIRTQTASALG